MNQEPPVLSPQICPKCGAANYAHVEVCWLCSASFKQDSGVTNPYAVEVGPQRAASLHNAFELPAGGLQSRTETVFLWLMVAIVVLAILVGIGLGAQDRGC